MSIHSQPAQDSTCRTGLEVYRTNEEDFKPYISSGVVQDNTTSSDEANSDTAGFSYHEGKILDTYYYAHLESTNHEYDYTDMSDNATFNVPYIDKNRFYKGIRVSVLKEWEAPGKTLSWNDLGHVIDGFITEQTFSENGVEVKVNGYSKLLDKKYVFNFSNMKRSKILEELIKTAGLTPVINVKGLDDDVTSFTTQSSDGSSSSSGESSGSTSIDEATKKAIEGLTDDLSKAKAVDKEFKNHVYYKYYKDVHHPDLEEAWKNAHLNCADGANILCAMFRVAGLDATIIHTPNHYIVRVKINGKTYYTDNAASTGSHTTRAFGSVWRGITSGSEVGAKISA